MATKNAKQTKKKAATAKKTNKTITAKASNKTRSTAKASSKASKSTKVTAKKTIHSTSGRMPAWVAKAPRFAKDYVIEMRSKGKPYDAKGYKVWRSEVIAKEKAAKAKAKAKISAKKK